MAAPMFQGIVHVCHVFPFELTDEQIRAAFEVMSAHPYQLSRFAFWSLVLEKVDEARQREQLPEEKP